MENMKFFRLKNGALEAEITNYGAKITRLLVPNQKGEVKDIILGFNTAKEWQTQETYFNAIIGRYANRIKDGKFTLNGKEYQLAVNNGGNNLHGGLVGFNEKYWNVLRSDEQEVVLQYVSPAGEENFPGTLTVIVTYTLQSDGLRIQYEAHTDTTTICGFTNHAYFNLAGEGSGTVHDHILQVNGDFYTPLDESASPTGEVLSVYETPMDFRNPVRVGDRIDDPFFAPGRGLDNNWVIRRHQQGEPALAATVEADGRKMNVWTTMPGLQVYTGNWVEQHVGKSGRMYDVQHAICLEAQGFPNSPNLPHFPTAVLHPNEVYFHWVKYQFVS